MWRAYIIQPKHLSLFQLTFFAVFITVHPVFPNTSNRVETFCFYLFYFCSLMFRSHLRWCSARIVFSLFPFDRSDCSGCHGILSSVSKHFKLCGISFAFVCFIWFTHISQQSQEMFHAVRDDLFCCAQLRRWWYAHVAGFAWDTANVQLSLLLSIAASPLSECSCFAFAAL